MARPTDTERGARIAYEEAVLSLQPDLFGYIAGDDGPLDQINAMWWGIYHAAIDQLAECKALREARA
ncbi:hypothetical protein [Xanthomonas euvesicatoria]|uniref:hypothetical protein n=1 Tax=Xanthomonas euvesicatoria TaxID=456327 RepID=UPI001C43EEA1|nr:hypothetical protein [Xanthomonas euvesicatoria]MBV6863820.1 hypothetical protein [Xanthomonas campestris pv. blepharidis]